MTDAPKPAPATQQAPQQSGVGNSGFESWYNSYSPAHKSDKQRACDAYAAGMGDPLATTAPVAGPNKAVAYLDVGAGGYLDLGTDLTNKALSRLPKGRHALVIAGTYGIDGYIAAPTTQQAPAGVLEDAARWHWMAEYVVGTRTDLDDELIASATVDELRKLVDDDLVARKQGGQHAD